MGKLEPPLFTLRGHVVGVSALSSLVINGETYLISGDEEGTVIVWDLDLYREVARHDKLIQSRAQSIKTVNLNVNNKIQSVVIAQSRNNGVECFLGESIRTKSLSSDGKLPEVQACFPTYENLFTRGDAIQLEDDKAILAYPAVLENSIITVRILENGLKTTLSGSAIRSTSKSSSVFDVKLLKCNANKCLLYVAYEDGHLCAYSVDQQSTTSTVPELGDIIGLKIDLIEDFDLKVGDFLSAFDVCHAQNGNALIVCGSPMKDLIFITHNPTIPTPSNELVIDNVDLKRKGVSAICMRPDRKFVAVSLWDCSVKLYSLRSQNLLANLKNHTGKVQSITFIDRPKKDIHGDFECELQTDKQTLSKQYILCCASQEGTISLSAIY